MADKSFGVKELNLISASGTPTITSPNSVNINATNVAISTDITVGGMVSLGAGTSISSPGSNVLTFGTNSTEKVRITSAGTVKIGSNTLITPSTDADNFVIDTGDADSGLSILSATTGRIYFGDAASTDQGSIRYVHTDDSMRFETNSSEKIRITSAGNVSIQNDSGKFTAGASDDLQIYHDGSSSYVSDTATGNLKLTSNGTAVQIEKSDGENMAIFRTDGSVDLFYDNAKKFETLSNGTQTTGRVYLNGTNGGLDYNNTQHTLEYLVNGSTHSELNTGAYVPQGTKNLGSNAKRWGTLYLSTGIDFGANSNAAGMTSEVLDDYEEGTFTPTVSVEGQSNANTDKNYGRYIKVGNKVTVWCYVQLNGTPSGRGVNAAWQHGGLPFSQRNTAGGFDVGGPILYWTIDSTSALNGTAPYHLQARLFNNSSGGRIRGTDSSNNQNGQNLSLLLKDNTEYTYTFTYEVG